MCSGSSLVTALNRFFTREQVGDEGEGGGRAQVGDEGEGGGRAQVGDEGLDHLFTREQVGGLKQIEGRLHRCRL